MLLARSAGQGKAANPVTASTPGCRFREQRARARDPACAKKKKLM
jgi:hypothetical protein